MTMLEDSSIQKGTQPRMIDCHNHILADIDERFFAASPNTKSRHDIIEAMLPYIEKEIAQGCKLNHISRHILGLYNGLKGAKAFRRHISENAHKKDANINVIIDAMQYVKDS